MRLISEDPEVLHQSAVIYFRETLRPNVVPGWGIRYLRADGARDLVGVLLVIETPEDQEVLLRAFCSVSVLLDGAVRLGLWSGPTPSADLIDFLSKLSDVHDRFDNWNPLGFLNQRGWNALYELRPVS